MLTGTNEIEPDGDAAVKIGQNSREAGFKDFELYASSAEQLPFSDNIFDIIVCNLSLNFFEDLNTVIRELTRVLKKQRTFICIVPVPERNKKQSSIRGKLYSEEQLNKLFTSYKFEFCPHEFKNGALLYFTAVLKDK